MQFPKTRVYIAWHVTGQKNPTRLGTRDNNLVLGSAPRIKLRPSWIVTFGVNIIRWSKLLFLTDKFRGIANLMVRTY